MYASSVNLRMMPFVKRVSFLDKVPRGRDSLSPACLSTTAAANVRTRLGGFRDSCLDKIVSRALQENGSVAATRPLLKRILLPFDLNKEQRGRTRPNSRMFSTTPAPRVRTRGSGSRGSFRVGRGDRNATKLLEKFVKRARYDGELIVKAPFDIKVSGSFFDGRNKVDRVKNRQAADELIHPPRTKDIDESFPAAATEESDEFSPQFYMEQVIESAVAAMGAPSTWPVHVLLYGRRYLRTHSFSTSASAAEQSRVYVTDVEDSPLDDDARFLSLMASNPRDLDPDFPLVASAVVTPENGHLHFEEDDAATKGAKGSSRVDFCIPSHLVDPPDNGFKGVVLTPTTMSKIFVKGARGGSVEIDGRLFNLLTVLVVFTEAGDIRLKNVTTAPTVGVGAGGTTKIRSLFGDIQVDSPLSPHINHLETGGDGDVFVNGTDSGSQNMIVTENGDIEVAGECKGASNILVTENGHVHVRALCSRAKVEVKDSGTMTLNIMEGSVNASLDSGAAFVNIRALTGDSSISLANGHLTVSVPKRRGFSIVAAAPNTDIASRLVNAGDVFIDPQSGHETFYVSASMDAAARLLNDADGAGNRTPPTLALYAERGTIVLETEAPSEVDSLGSTDDEFDLL